MSIEQEFISLQQKARAASDKKIQLQAQKESLELRLKEFLVELRDKFGIDDPRKLGEIIQEREFKLIDQKELIQKQLEEFDQKVKSYENAILP